MSNPFLGNLAPQFLNGLKYHWREVSQHRTSFHEVQQLQQPQLSNDPITLLAPFSLFVFPTIYFFANFPNIFLCNSRENWVGFGFFPPEFLRALHPLTCFEVVFSFQQQHLLNPSIYSVLRWCLCFGFPPQTETVSPPDWIPHPLGSCHHWRARSRFNKTYRSKNKIIIHVGKQLTAKMFVNGRRCACHLIINQTLFLESLKNVTERNDHCHNSRMIQKYTPGKRQAYSVVCKSAQRKTPFILF